ncbi:MAG: stage II sporulation protein P [Clostridia bacterium]|nr:stage II sporulation protein P [Clostridia bacterium]
MRAAWAGWGAALCALAVFVGGSAGLYHRRSQPEAPLVIEVIKDAPQEAAAQPAAAQQRMPTVLIYHTHTWEAYEMTQAARYTPTQTWRTMDDAHNMVRVGEELARLLKEHGFSVTHDQTDFEPPNLSSAYTRSLDMLKAREEAGEAYDYILDVHRDAYSGDWNGDNCVTGKDGVRRAYVMMLVGKGTGTTGAGFDERPDWPQNHALAKEITDAMNAIVPGISRDVKTKTGRFNQHVSTGALLIEVGNNKNTLEEALAACPVIAQALERVDRARAAQQ